MIRLIQIACIVVTVAILYGINKATDGIGHLLGDNFDAGFLVGGVFVIGLYLVICWIDPSSRPRGAAVQQKRFDDRVH